MAPTAGEKLQAAFTDLEFIKLPSPEEHPVFKYYGFEPSKQILSKGHIRREGCRPFPVDVIYERDTAIRMRDNAKLYADIFRPTTSDTPGVPAIIPWSPYGKTGTGAYHYENMAPFRAGLPEGLLSGYEKFEAPDPAEWCARGYAIINVDARGAGRSEGNVNFWGMQEAEDIYDTAEWLSRQEWCNGSVAMAGNSWLSIAQINHAARCLHPAIKALAPWEGMTDPYADLFMRGGKVHNAQFNNLIVHGMAGPNSVENMPAMVEKHPFYDDFWKSKSIHVEHIDNVPLYVLASYSTGLHSRGSFDTFRKAKTAQKWLRVHPYQEWYDLYRPDMMDDLQKYFDHYCKGIDNGWEKDTPAVRLSLLGFENSGATTIVERPENEYPLKRQKMQTLYLNGSNGTLDPKLPNSSSTSSHEAHHLTASSDFTYFFEERTELAGYPMVCLWMSCAEKDDMDVVVQIRKIDAHGNLLEHLNYPCPVPVTEVPDVNVVKTLGPQGFLRASHSVSRDETKCQGTEIFYAHDRAELIKAGEVVPLEITLWPIGMVFAKGEGIMLRISGHDMNHPEVELVRLRAPEDMNVGIHVVHTGRDHDSSLTIPVIPSSN